MAGKKDIVEQALKLIAGEPAERAFSGTFFKTPEGKPMRLYHMTPEDIQEFSVSPENRSGPAVFLSPYPEVQPAYHSSAYPNPLGEPTSNLKEGANVMPVYADVQNPLVLDHPRKIKEAASRYQGGDLNFPRILTPEARAAMEAEGYDGIVFGGENPIPYGDRPMDARLGHQEARDEEFIVFDPKHIKSAISNTGEYDFTNPDITKSEGGLVRGEMPIYGIAAPAGALAVEAMGEDADEDIDNAVRVAKGGGGGFLRRAVTNLLGPSERKGLMELTRPGSGYESPKGKPGTVKLPNIGEAEAKPIPGIMEASESYMKKRGMLGGHELAEYPDLDEAFAMRVAEAYDRMKHAPDDPEVRRAYDAMAQETIDQLAAAKDAGIDFTAIRGADPYAASPSLGYADIAERGNLYFFPTDAGFGSSIEFDPSQNPLLKRIGRVGDLDNATVNDAFRIVHDLYGHYGPGNPFFRAPGEERAYLLHRRMYSPEALPAMTSETRGQNSWLNYGPYGPRNRSASSEDTVFADQKTGIMDPFTYLERADGGAVNDAVRIAKDIGGGTTPQVMMEDAKGNKYDASGKLIPPVNPGPNPAMNQNQVAFDLPPENYETDVKPFMDYAFTPMDRPGMPSEPDLVDAMRVATQIAASGQPTDTRGAQNWGRQRAEAVRSAMGADPEGRQSEYRGPFTYNPGEMAGYVNTLLDFVAVPEMLHDIPYEAVRTGDYTNAAIEGGLNALLSAPGIAALGAAGRAGYNALRRNPKIAAGIAGAGLLAAPSEAEAGPARWFSKAMEVAQAIPMQKMTGEQALAMLRKGVSPEELRWTGTDAFLSGQKSVTKDDLLAHLAKNRIQTQEVVLGNGNKPFRREDVRPDEDIIAQFRPQMTAGYQDVISKTKAFEDAKRALDAGGNREENFDIFDAAAKQMSIARANMASLQEQMIDAQIEKMGGLAPAPKYKDYSTPGGENYQETLVRYGGMERPRVVQQGNSWTLRDANNNPVFNSQGAPYFYYSKADAEKAAKSIYRQSGKYESSHWDDPDVLLHTRSQVLDVTPPGANRPYKAWNVDEAQSDWGQEGRKEGFKNTEAMAQVARLREESNKLLKDAADMEMSMRDLHYAKLRPIQNERQDVIDEIIARFKRGEISAGEYNKLLNDNHNSFEDRILPIINEYKERIAKNVTPLRQRIAENEKAINELGSKIGTVPDAPYVTSTEGWTDLAIKKQLDKALDAGSDYFTWTPGDVHADRYSLDKQIEALAYDPYSQQLDYKQKGSSPYGWESLGSEVPPEKLENYVGKEVAEKLLSASKNDDGVHMLRGLDLKTGGEGMRGYYDKVYPKRLQEVIRKATGEKPNIEVIEVQTADGPRKQLGIRLTDEMREKARFSDFNKGGRVTYAGKYADSDAVNRALALTSED